MRGTVTAVVLAGERPGRRALAEAAGVPCKALLPVGGRPMVERVVDALRGSPRIGPIAICGPDAEAPTDAVFAALLRREGVSWVPAGATPAASVAGTLSRLGDRGPVLVTTADHALLAPRVVDHFVGGAEPLAADLVAGVARYERVHAGFPALRKTKLRLRDGAWCGCNLFLLKTPEARRGVEFWQRVEAHRKRPWRAAGVIGWWFLGLYLAGWMSLDAAVSRIGRRMGLRAAAVEIPLAEAAVDVDSEDDWHVIDRVLRDGWKPGGAAGGASSP